MLRGTFGDAENKRIKEVYFSTYPGVYFTGDGARVDEDGDFWLMGRVDDVINISGHRLGTAEVESALVSHEAVAEAAVVGYPHDIKGEGIYAYVTLKQGVEPTDDLKKTLIGHVRTVIGPIATPDKLHFAPGLPKTRSGKIMRRILRKIAHNEIDQPRRHLHAARPGGRRHPRQGQAVAAAQRTAPRPRPGRGAVFFCQPAAWP